MIALALKVLLAYLLGSISGSKVMGRLRDVDIRASGSGNAGGTNAFRTQGFRFALGVVIIDIGKGALAAWGVPLLPLGDPAVSVSLQAMACGFAAVIGHCYPLHYFTTNASFVFPGFLNFNIKVLFSIVACIFF